MEMASNAPSLSGMVTAFKAELGLEGNTKDVVDEACANLGVSATGSLVERATQCHSILFNNKTKSMYELSKRPYDRPPSPIIQTVEAVAVPMDELSKRPYDRPPSPEPEPETFPESAPELQAPIQPDHAGSGTRKNDYEPNFAIIACPTVPYGPYYEPVGLWHFTIQDRPRSPFVIQHNWIYTPIWWIASGCYCLTQLPYTEQRVTHDFVLRYPELITRGPAKERMNRNEPHCYDSKWDVNT